MRPSDLAERLVPGAMVADPFPHFVHDQPLPESLAGELLRWMETGASWRLHTSSFFEQFEMDLTAASAPASCRVVFAPETLAALGARMGTLFGRHMTGQVRATAHKLVGGQTIGIHTDEPRGDRETHRLLVHVNSGWHADLGGEMLLLAGDGIDALRAVVPPHHNRAVGFEMSERSFHAVARVNQWVRYTLIFSFWADDRPIPELTRHVPMPRREQILTFLRDCGAARLAHSGGTFLDHLKGVEHILDRWGTSLEVRMAGLMHSIYGTEGFPNLAPVDEARVVDLLGADAEALVRRFCAMDTASLVDSVVGAAPALRARDGQSLPATPRQIDALLLLHLANTAEQLPRLRGLTQVIDDDHAEYLRLRPYVPQAARVELDALFDRLRGEASGTDADTEQIVAALRAYIQQAGGEDCLCGSQTLLDYLVRMEAWLVAESAPAVLRIAALAQGLYGWKADLGEQNRAVVRVVAGPAAERLAWLFAAADDQAVHAALASADAVDAPEPLLLACDEAVGAQAVSRTELDALLWLSRAAEAAA